MKIKLNRKVIRSKKCYCVGRFFLFFFQQTHDTLWFKTSPANIMYVCKIVPYNTIYAHICVHI